jgi:glycosyltransferase involved in cell wall biosynthesis
MSRLLVVVPAWNEELSVRDVVVGIRSVGLDVLVVDDGSRDGTSRVAEAAGAAVVRLPINLGVGGALRCGFRYAVERGYDAVVQCDADGQHIPSEIAALVAAREATGAHLVIGSRFHPDADGFEVGLVRRSVMRLLARSASRATGTSISDATSGFRLFAEPLLSAFAAEFPAHYLGDTYEAVATAGRAGYSVVELPVRMRARTHGQSSASPVAAARLTIRALVVVGARLHFNIPPCSVATVAADSPVGTGTTQL